MHFHYISVNLDITPFVDISNPTIRDGFDH
jgi:hypothetical protein